MMDYYINLQIQIILISCMMKIYSNTFKKFRIYAYFGRSYRFFDRYDHSNLAYFK